MSRGQMRTRSDEPVKYDQDFLPEREQLYAHYRPTSSIHHQPANNPYQPVCASLCVLHTPWQPCVHGTWPSANCAKNMKALADFDGQVHSDCLQSSEYLARYQPRSTAHELPTSADEFLWGKSMFNTLGRFEGMNDEMSYIVAHSLADYPAWQAGAALRAMGRQLLHVATGEGTNGWIPHTYGIIERYIPAQVAPMRAARQQHWDVDFAYVNWLHVPVALASMLALALLLAHALANRRLDDLTLLRR